MKKTECADLLQEIAAIDNRAMSNETVEAWFAVIGHIPFEIAREALHLARKDDRVSYLEPRHIVSWARDAAIRLDREAGRNIPQEPQGQFVKQPECRSHNKPLLSCEACCRRLKPLAEKHKNEILIYAKEHII